MEQREASDRNYMSALKNVLMGTLVSPLRFTNEVSNKVVYIGYHNILRILYTALGFNVVLILLDIKKVLKFNLAFYVYGPVPVLAKLFSLVILTGLIYVHSTKGLFVNKGYLEKELEDKADSMSFDEEKVSQDTKEEELKVERVVDNPADDTFSDLLDDSFVIVKKEESNAKKAVEKLLEAKLGLEGTSKPTEIVEEAKVIDLEEVVQDEDPPNETDSIELTEEEEKLINAYTSSVQETMEALKSSILNPGSKAVPKKKTDSKSIFDDDNFMF